MRFTQFKFPDGLRISVSIDRPSEIEAKAQSCIDQDVSFEIECDPQSNSIWMTAMRRGEGLVDEFCSNGSGEVGRHIDSLVNRTAKLLIEGQL